jgi:hypothetical protein
VLCYCFLIPEAYQQSLLTLPQRLVLLREHRQLCKLAPQLMFQGSDLQRTAGCNELLPAATAVLLLLLLLRTHSNHNLQTTIVVPALSSDFRWTW